MLKSLMLALLCTLPFPLWAAHILVISSYHAGYSWDQSYNEGLREGLKGDHAFSHFYMDTKRHPASNYDEVADRALAYYHKVKPDLVVLGDDIAIQYLANDIASFGTPVVFLGMNENPRLKGFVGHPKITGVLERPLLKRSISEMSQLMGGLGKALVLFDASHVARTAIEYEFKQQTSLRIGRTLIDSQQIGDYASWQKAEGNSRCQKKWLPGCLYRPLSHTGGPQRPACQRADCAGLGQCSQPGSPVQFLGIFGGQGQDYRRFGARWP